MTQERLEESPSFSPKLPIKGITRRELIELGLAFGARFAGRRLFPVSGALPNPQRPVSELVASPEILELNIPGVTIERYPAELPDITDEVPESVRNGLKAWVEQPDFDESGLKRWPPLRVFWMSQLNYRQHGPALLGIDWIRADRGPMPEKFYFNGAEARFYTRVLGGSDNSGRIGDDDRRLLNWEGSIDLNDLSISSDGKILYQVVKFESVDDSIGRNGRHAMFIENIPNSTRTLIRDSAERYIRGTLSDDGSKLLLSFPYNTATKRGTYLINLSDWQVRFHTDDAPFPFAIAPFLNEDGSLLYLSAQQGDITDKSFNLFNTATGEKTTVRWPDFLTSYRHIASRDLHHIVRLLGIFPAMQYVEGQWGMMTYTPEGFFMIRSPGWSFAPQIVDYAGNIYTHRGDVFKFEGGTYKLVKMGPETQLKVEKDGKPIEVRVTKLPK